VGSDHIDLNAAVEHKVQVLEVHFEPCRAWTLLKLGLQVSGSNVVSVAEHVVMSILLLVRNFVPAHEVCHLPVASGWSAEALSDD
jgi:formate dehydrogenase